MDWLLAALALFNLVSMVTVFSPRAVTRRAVPWALFGTALLATELAWIWLPLQLSWPGYCHWAAHWTPAWVVSPCLCWRSPGRAWCGASG